MCRLTIFIFLFTAYSFSSSIATWDRICSGNAVTGIVHIGQKIWLISNRKLHYVERDDTTHAFTIPNTDVLKDKTISCIKKDSKNTLWIGTDTGLYSFSNNIWQSHEYQSGPDLECKVLFVDKNDNLWIGTQIGLFRYNRTDWHYFDTLDSYKEKYDVSHIIADSSGAIWILSGNSAYRYNQTNWDAYKQMGIVLHLGLWNGNAFIATYEPASGNGKVVGYNGETWVRFGDNDPGYPFYEKGSCNIECSIIDTAGNLWISNGTKTIQYDGSEWAHSTEIGPSKTFAIDSQGQLWAGTRYDCAFYENNAWQYYRSNKSVLPSNTVTCMIETKNSEKWLGTASGALHLVEGQWKSYPSQHSINKDQEYITAIIEDSNGVIWIGTRGGIAKLSEGQWQFFTKENSSLPCNEIFSMFPIENGNMYINCLEGRRSTKIGLFDGTNWSIVAEGMYDRALLYDSNNNLWIYQYNYLAKYNKGEKVSYNSTTIGASTNSIYSLYEDRDGIVWAISGNKLSAYNGSTWTSSEIPDTFSGTYPNRILKDTNGTFWIGMKNSTGQGGYLVEYNSTEIISYKSAHSFFGDYTTNFITEDNDGKIWIGTDYGGVYILTTNKSLTKTVHSVQNKTHLYRNSVYGTLFNLRGQRLNETIRNKNTNPKTSLHHKVILNNRVSGAGFYIFRYQQKTANRR